MKLRLSGQAILQVAGLNHDSIKYSKEDIQNIDSYVPQVEYTLPFKGVWYTANGRVTRNTSYSWEVLPQRFAYDFMIMDEEGNNYGGEVEDLHTYYCYGMEVLATVDGRVISIKKYFPDCRKMSDGQTDPDTPDIGGNRIIIQHTMSCRE